jgi:hypothetical protein
MKDQGCLIFRSLNLQESSTAAEAGAESSQLEVPKVEGGDDGGEARGGGLRKVKGPAEGPPHGALPGAPQADPLPRTSTDLKTQPIPQNAPETLQLDRGQLTAPRRVASAAGQPGPSQPKQPPHRQMSDPNRAATPLLFAGPWKTPTPQLPNAPPSQQPHTRNQVDVQAANPGSGVAAAAGATVEGASSRASAEDAVSGEAAFLR